MRTCSCRWVLGTALLSFCILQASAQIEQDEDWDSDLLPHHRASAKDEDMQVLPGLKRLLPVGEIAHVDSTEQTSSTTEESEGGKAQMGAASVEGGKQSQDRGEERLDPKESTAVQRRYASELEAGAQLAAPLAVTKATQSDSEGAPVVEIHVATVLVMTVLMAAAAALGAVPFFFVGSLSKEWAALANAIACGVMLACSFDLMHEGQPYGGGLVVLGILIGALFISASQQWLERFEDVRFQGLQGINARKILLMIGIMAAHAFGEGAGVGVSFCGSRGWAQGVLVTLAIGLHNIPEGLAVSTVLVARGISPRRALLWTLVTAMPQPLVAVPSFLFVDTFRVLLPVALGFAAGCMLWMVFAELLPDALADAAHGKVATVGTFSAAWLEGLRMMLATLEGGNGHLSMPGIVNRSTLNSALCLVAPAVLFGGLAGRLGKLLVREGPAALGLAAGILAWQGGFDLTRSLAFGQRSDALAKSAAAAAGALAVLLLWRIQTMWAAGTPKLKQGDTPVKGLSDESPIVIAAEQNGVNGHYLQPEDRLEGLAQPHAAVEPDLELAGVKRRIFAPYHEPRRQQERGVLAMGLAAVALMGAGEGFRIAHSASLEAIAARQLWLPVTLRAVLPGIAASALLGAGSRRSWPASLAAGLLAAAAPVTGVLERIHMDVGDGGAEQHGLHLAAACSAAALTTGLWVVWPAARRADWRRATQGLLKGSAVGLVACSLSGLMCWQNSFCIR